mmetsp:Transcript_27044/g.89805  ORF Transcript_27044/g.89805 Transcript_27044/m.89805 type:complete len:867 (-) Transcript_27044:95-2695(-)
MGFEPIPPERHKYSLLHATPEASAPAPTPPAKMPPFAAAPSDEPYSEIPRRHALEFVGHRCPVIDAKGALSPNTMQELRKYMDIRNPMPCVIKNLPLFQRSVDSWDVEYLAQHMGDQLYHTFASSRDEKRFAYFFDERNEGGYEAPPIAEACKMTFKEFVQKQRDPKDGRAYYLQTPVLRYEGDQVTCAKFDERLEADLHAMDNKMMQQLAELGSFGPISRNQLFVSFSDFMTAIHYDQQHNLFLQIRGAKRFLLFDGALLPAVYAYPSHHPLDRKARLDLENPDFERFSKARALKGRGVEAVLERGDILFMPMSWFHHVHSVGAENVSLNWWFYDSGVLFEPSKVLWPLSPPSLVEFSRHVEYFIAEQLGPINVGRFVAWWLGRGPGALDSLLLDRWRLMRNYVMQRLALLPGEAGRSVLAMLDPLRWRDLAISPAPPKALQGLQDEHHVQGLLEGLSELSMGLFRCSMTGQAFRGLGRAIDEIPREKLRMFLECSEELLVLLRDHTDWKGEGEKSEAQVPPKGAFLFNREEAKRAPLAISRGLGDLCDLAAASRVVVTTVDNGFFANWLQVLDARLFAGEAAAVEPAWVLTGNEREFNYGEAGDDVFAGLFEALTPEPASASATGVCAEPHMVRNRQNLLLVNVFRGRFLQGPWAKSRRRLYSDAAKKIFRPCKAALTARDEALASVHRAPGAPLIGVHKRVDNPGTARMQLAQVMPCTAAYIRAVKTLAARRAGSAAAAEAAVVVLATDDEGAVAAFREAFGERLVFRGEARRCAGGIDPQSRLPIEVHGQSGNRLTIADARDCLIDALLLAACDAFVHADSNVTIAAGIMNPDTEAVQVRDLVPDAQAAGEWPGYRRCRLPI